MAGEGERKFVSLSCLWHEQVELVLETWAWLERGTTLDTCFGSHLSDIA